MGTPDYVLIEEKGEMKAGTFVRPIKIKYLPKGWEDWVKGAGWFNPDTETVCYTPKGLCILPNSSFRQT